MRYACVVDYSESAISTDVLCVCVWEGFVGIASKPILLEYVSYL